MISPVSAGPEEIIVMLNLSRELHEEGCSRLRSAICGFVKQGTGANVGPIMVEEQRTQILGIKSSTRPYFHVREVAIMLTFMQGYRLDNRTLL